jgi:hypothetical protein
MAKPDRYHLDNLRKLRGDAYVTHPDATLTVRRVERVFSVPRGSDETAYLAVDPAAEANYAGCVLVEQHTVGGDHIYVEVYQAWQTLPGATIVGQRLNERGAKENVYTESVQTGTDPQDGGLTVTSSQVVPINAVMATKTYSEVTEGHGTLVSKTYNSERAFGARTATLDNIIASGTPLPSLNATTALFCQDIPIDQFKVRRLTTALETDAVQPTIYQFDYDERLGFLIQTEKQIVTAQTTPPSQSAGVTVEYHPIDKWIGVQITSRTNKNEAALAALARHYPVTLEHRFPNILTAATWYYQYALGDDGTISIDVSLVPRITAGYAGPCDGVVYEYFTYDPTAKLAALIIADTPGIPGNILKVLEETFNTTAGWTITGSQSVAHVQTFTLPPTLHNEITIGLDGNVDGATLAGDFPGFATTIPATSPTTAGDFLGQQYLLKSVDTYLYKVGVYILRLTVIENPHWVFV